MGGGEDAGPPPPSEPWTTKERLVTFYTKYQPDKLDGIDGILEKYAGKEDKLFMPSSRSTVPNRRILTITALGPVTRGTWRTKWGPWTSRTQRSGAERPPRR